MHTLLFDGKVTLERFAGKGSWTFAPLPLLPDAPTGTHFGLLKVTGRIDAHELPPANLMPLGKGRKFLPLNAALRKQIGKQAGDEVHLVLHLAEAPPAGVSAAELQDCLADVPGALSVYQSLNSAQQQAWLAWVNQSAHDDNALVARLAEAAERLGAGQAAPPVTKR